MSDSEEEYEFSGDEEVAEESEGDEEIDQQSDDEESLRNGKISNNFLIFKITIFTTFQTLLRRHLKNCWQCETN